MTRRLRGDEGQVAGVEAVPFGLLVLVVGLLLIAHTWAVVDAKFAAAVAAREATRAFVESPSATTGARSADLAAADAVSRSGRSTAGLHLERTTAGFDRCLRSRFVARLRVPSVGLPWRSARPSVAVRSGYEEVVDPYRDGLQGLAVCRLGP